MKEFQKLKGTKFFNKISAFKELSSTSLYIKNNLHNLTEHSVIWAETQTEGYGRNKRQWYSYKGGLYFSFLLKNYTMVSLLPIIIAVAVGEILREYCFIKYKWPNDLYSGSKKISGILIENIWEKQGIYTIAGIGINVNNKISNEEISHTAISLIELTHKEISISNLLIRILKNLDSMLNESYIKENKKNILVNYRKSMIKNLYAEINTGKSNERIFIKDIDEAGNLLALKGHSLQHYSYGEIVKINFSNNR